MVYREFLVELESRRSLPLSPLILMLIALSFAIRPVESKGLARGIFITVVICFAYYFFTAEALSFGRNGTLSPVIASWIANGIFGLIGVILFSAIRS